MIQALAASPDLLAKLMQSAAAQSSAASAVGASGLPMMPPSLLGVQPSAGGINPEVLQASLQGGAPEGFMTGNMPELGGEVNNIPQELASMGYTPSAEPKKNYKDIAKKIAAMQQTPIEHHPLAQSNAQYIPLEQSTHNPYASATQNMGLMELMARARQTV
jgi:hypothetical protein